MRSQLVARKAVSSQLNSRGEKLIVPFLSRSRQYYKYLYVLYGLCKGYTMNASVRWNIERQASGVAWVILLSHTRGAISNRIRALLSKRLRTWSHLRRNIFYADSIVLFTLGVTLSFCFGCRRSVGRILWITMFFFLWNIVQSLQFRWLICCGYKPVYRARGTWGRPCHSRVTCIRERRHIWDLGGWIQWKCTFPKAYHNERNRAKRKR